MMVTKLMYGYGALTWYRLECDNLEVIYKTDLADGYGKNHVCEKVGHMVDA